MKIRKYKEAVYPDSDNCYEKESEWLRQVTIGSWLERSPEKCGSYMMMRMIERCQPHKYPSGNFQVMRMATVRKAIVLSWEHLSQVPMNSELKHNDPWVKEADRRTI